MGEDIDDFVVKTKSKTDQIIRDYTAVASNMYKGVSVLDANGNLRDTYDILLDISKVYKEIQEEDKQKGTNRAQALIEELAGKNRSNIASSILLNGDVLEQVRNASATDYVGSADQELEKYLDSIDGRIQKLQNHLQELAAVNINSDWLKAMISLADSAVKVITKITDAVGGVNIAIGAVAGTLTSLTGHGKLKWVRQKPKMPIDTKQK